MDAGGHIWFCHDVIRVAWGMTAPLREKRILDMIGSR